MEERCNMTSSNKRTVDLTVAIPPRKLGSVGRAITDHLQNLKSKYVPEIGGVLIDWTELNILNEHGILVDDQPYAFWKVRFLAEIFEPVDGKLFKGKIHRIQKQYLIVKAMEFMTATVTIPDALAEDSVIQNLTVDQEIYFRLTYSGTGGDYRGDIDEECIELTSSLVSQQMEVDPENFDYGKDFEY